MKQSYRVDFILTNAYCDRLSFSVLYLLFDSPLCTFRIFNFIPFPIIINDVTATTNHRRRRRVRLLHYGHNTIVRGGGVMSCRPPSLLLSLRTHVRQPNNQTTTIRP